MANKEKELARKARYRDSHREKLNEDSKIRFKRVRNTPQYFQWSLGYRYNLTISEYEKIWKDQGGLCAIDGCGVALDSGPRRPHIDHNKKCCPGEKSCGKCVRGILCGPHNLALGCVKDSKEQLLGLIEYLETRVA